STVVLSICSRVGLIGSRSHLRCGKRSHHATIEALFSLFPPRRQGKSACESPEANRSATGTLSTLAADSAGRGARFFGLASDTLCRREPRQARHLRWGQLTSTRCCDKWIAQTGTLTRNDC